jgi:hypothetical protein
MSRRSRRKKKAPQPAPPVVVRGLWRDGNYLVISENSHHFPRRCVKTNEPVEKPKEFIQFATWGLSYSDLQHLSPAQRAEVLDTRPLLGQRNVPSHSVQLRLPLNQRWQWIFRTWSGVWAIAAGAVIAIVGQLSLNSKELEPSVLLPLWRGLLVLGIGLALCGGLFLFAVNWMLSIRHMADGKIWIAGVHRDFLKPLPDYVPMRQTLEHEMFRGNWQLWTYLSLGIVFVVLILVAVAVGASRDPDYRSVIIGLLIAIAVAILLASLGSSQMHRARRQLTKLYLSKERRRRN